MNANSELGIAIIIAAFLVSGGLAMSGNSSDGPSLTALSYAGEALGKEIAKGLAQAACIEKDRDWKYNGCQARTD